jgi:hypothetical protein
MRSGTRLFSFLALCLAISALGQDKPAVLVNRAPPPSDRFPASWYPGPSDEIFHLAVDKNAPYTATLVDTDQCQCEGKIVTHSTSAFEARDSSGRTHYEIEGEASLNPQGEWIHQRTVTVRDPVSHCDFRWVEPAVDPERPAALVNCLPRTLHYINRNFWAFEWVHFSVEEPKDKDPSILSEPLGKRMFGDVEAEGLRRTVTYTIAEKPDEIQKGVIEMWYSPEIKEKVRERLDNSGSQSPQGTQALMQLTNIKRMEPDSKLFYPPKEYEIQPGKFAVPLF